jgi:nucleoside-diphosphate-sugar epimerase
MIVAYVVQAGLQRDCYPGSHYAKSQTCVVLGGSSQAGSWLVPSLIEGGWTVHLISRGLKAQFDYGARGIWHKLDLRSMNAQFPAVEARVVFDTFGVASDWLERMSGTGVRRAISFSSTSVFTKTNSDDPVDIRAVQDVQKREHAFAETSARLQVDWTILRPTLIYGGKFGDRTVNDIARVIRLFGFFPVREPGGAAAAGSRRRSRKSLHPRLRQSGNFQSKLQYRRWRSSCLP